MLRSFLLVLLLQQPTHRTIAIDERLAADARLSIGDRVLLSATPSSTTPDTVVIGAIIKRGTDPAEVARSEYRIKLHLDQLQSIAAYGDRVDRFAVETRNDAATAKALDEINSAITDVLDESSNSSSSDPRQAIQDAIDGLLTKHGVDLNTFKSQLQALSDSSDGSLSLIDEKA